MPSMFVCPNCGVAHDASATEGGCFLDMLVAVVRDRGTVPDNLLAQAAGSLDVEAVWEEFMDPAVTALEEVAKALVPKPRRSRRKGVPAAARSAAPAVPAAPSKTFQVLMGNGDRKLYQAPDKETAELMHKTAHPRDKTQQTVEIRR